MICLCCVIVLKTSIAKMNYTKKIGVKGWVHPNNKQSLTSYLL